MKYRVLGKTGLRVSEIGFGCGNVGGMMIRGTREEQLLIVSRAIAAGINYFDTASAYGDGKSETNLGRVLAELRPRVTVATKVRLGGNDLTDIKGAVQRSLEASLSRLRRDSVDVLQLHTQVSMERGTVGWPNAVGLRDVLGKDGVVDAFEAVRSEGLVRFVGFTGLGETTALHRIVESRRFDVVQAYYNLLNPSAGVAVPSGFASNDFRQLIDLAASNGMGVVVIRVMAGGALGGEATRRGYASPPLGRPMVPGNEYEVDERRAEKLGSLVAGDIGSLPQATVCFALMHPGVSTVLVGFSNLSQIDEAVTASGKVPLPKSKMRRLSELWSSDFEREPA